jgi:hypothetical protein
VTDPFVYEDHGEAWLRMILSDHREEACARVRDLLEQARETADGCLLTATREPRKVRFRGRQIPAYRFVYAVLSREVLSWHDVVRHRCHRRRCVNPAHLQRGDRRDNKHDDWDFRANGLDRRVL